MELGFDDDEELLDEGPFGATSWYLFLAERIDPKVAFEAALGWNGDAVRRRRATTAPPACRVGFGGDDAEDEDGDGRRPRGLGGRHAGRRGRGRSRSTATRCSRRCDPGEDLDLELTGRSESSLFLPNLWGYLVADASSVLDPDEARCYARTVVDELTYEEITDPDGAAFADDAFQDLLTEAFEACRLGVVGVGAPVAVRAEVDQRAGSPRSRGP